MKKCSALFVWLGVHFCLAAARADWKVTPVSSLQKLTAQAQGFLEPFEATPAKLQAARGEWENFQVVVTADDKPLDSIEVTISDLVSPQGKISAAQLHLFWENFVYVSKPSGNRRLERLWWPDALIPLELQKDTALKPFQSRVLWVNVRAPESAAPGDYNGAIAVSAGGETQKLPFQIRVEKVALAPPSCRANVAVYYDVLRDWYKKNARELSETEFQTLKTNYYDFLLDYRLNAYDLPVPWSSDAAPKYLRDPRVLSVRTPPLGREDFPQSLTAFQQTKALSKAYYYWIDEPAPERYGEIKSTTQKLRELRIKHCVTVHPNVPLEGAVDIWCPNIGDFFGTKHLKFAALTAQRQKGRETWWYTMAWPRYPYPTWLLDDDAASVRIYGWLMARHGINGFVYSMVHGWGPKPLENLESFGDTNGDGTLLYPAAALDKDNLQPLPSIRLMLLRDAIEDYELLLSENALSHTTLFWEADLKLTQQWEQAAGLTQISSARQAIFHWLRHTSDEFTPVDYVSELLSPKRIVTFIPDSTRTQIDGTLDDYIWQKKAIEVELRRVPNETSPVKTRVRVAHDGKNLIVAARCPLMPRAFDAELKGEWFCVDLAGPTAQGRWRFVVTPSGRGIVEKHTRQGHFRIEGINWKFAARATRDFYNVELQIPLKELGLGEEFRFNARRQMNDTRLGIKYMLHAYPDAEDVTLMPLALCRTLPANH